jgi:hypothetical protein
MPERRRPVVPALLAWLGELAVQHALVLEGVPAATHARRVFERSLIASLADTEHATSVGYNLRSLKSAAFAVRERLSQEHWNVIVRAETEFFRQCAICTEDGDYSTSGGHAHAGHRQRLHRRHDRRPDRPHDT